MRARRPSKKKNVRKVFLVICEGETEEEYINGLKRSLRVPVQVKTRICGNKITQRLISQYLAELGLEKEDSCSVFFVYDADVEPIVDRLATLDGTLILSNPCIELWFLLHSVSCHQRRDSNSVVRDLAAAHPVWGNYRKGRLTAKQWQYLELHGADAVRNASKLKWPDNPSSNMNLLLDEMSKKS